MNVRKYYLVDTCPVQPGCLQTFTGQPKVDKNSRKWGWTEWTDCCKEVKVRKLGKNFGQVCFRFYHISEDFLPILLPTFGIENVNGVRSSRADSVQGLQVVDEARGVTLQGDETRHRGVHIFLKRKDKR